MSTFPIPTKAPVTFALLSNLTTQATNSTVSSNREAGQDLTILVPLLLCCIVVFLIGVPGNMMVIHVLGIKHRANRNNDGDVFIVSLAVADLLASATVPLVIVHDLLSNHRWYLSEFLCHLLPVLNPVTLVTSSWALVVISAERYRIISRPFSARLSRKAKAILIASVWLFALAVNIPLAEQIRYHDIQQCTVDLYPPAEQIAYASFFIVAGWLLPGAVLSTLYFHTAVQLRSSEEHHSETHVMQLQIRKENKRVVRMFVIIIALFFVFTMPFAIYQITFSYLFLFELHVIRNNTFLSKLYLILPCISAMNSCFNPLVYAKMHKEVNRYIRRTCLKIPCFGRVHQTRCQSIMRDSLQKSTTKMDSFVSGNQGKPSLA